MKTVVLMKHVPGAENLKINEGSAADLFRVLPLTHQAVENYGW